MAADQHVTFGSTSAGDTITIPSDNMLLAGLIASRGDAVYRLDETTNELEARIAKMTGKEAALFCVSGTMTNRELALFTVLPICVANMACLHFLCRACHPVPSEATAP